jgi:hypothetical protein
MKRARQRHLKPRNPVAIAPLLKKGGATSARTSAPAAPG